MTDESVEERIAHDYKVKKVWEGNRYLPAIWRSRGFAQHKGKQMIPKRA